MSDTPRSINHHIKGEQGITAHGYAHQGEASTSSSSASTSAPTGSLFNSSTMAPSTAAPVIIPPGFTSNPIGDDSPPAPRVPIGAALGPRANLLIGCNINEMAVGWTHFEFDEKRRLIKFYRFQSGNDITILCQPIAARHYDPNSCIVSCIYSDDKDACFITSVDLIYLLEFIVQTRFVIEEKNRIRRNLEGYHPITLSKNKEDTEPFFKRVMGFNNPKPRNIEKDVKVFLWKATSEAVKKITGKYLCVVEPSPSNPNPAFVDELTAIGKETSTGRDSQGGGSRPTRPRHGRTASLGSTPYQRPASHHPRTGPIREAMTVANTPSLPANSTGAAGYSISPAATHPTFHYGSHAEVRSAGGMRSTSVSNLTITVPIRLRRTQLRWPRTITCAKTTSRM